MDDSYTNGSDDKKKKKRFRALTSVLETKRKSVKDDLVVGKQTHKSQTIAIRIAEIRRL